MDKIIENLAGLGIAYACPTPNLLADPEKTLIESVGVFDEDFNALKLVLSWLKNYEDLLHLERLKALIKVVPNTTKAWLGGIATYTQSKRWAPIIREVEGVRLNEKTNEFRSLQVERHGADASFKKYGILLPTLDISGIEKKLLSRDHILRNHFWLRLRALFGANWRADIVWQMYQNPEQTPYQVAKTLGCNMETAYRNWKALEQANVREFLRKQ